MNNDLNRLEKIADRVSVGIELYALFSCNDIVGTYF